MRFFAVFAFVLLVQLCAMVSAAPFPSERDGVHDSIRDKRETLDMLEFLTHYGYLQQPFHDDREKGLFMSDDVITSAIKEFQRFAGLELTGVPDEETLMKMKMPRCGIPDIIHNATNAYNGRIPMAFSTFNVRWPTETVTWKPTKFSKKLGEGEQWSAIQRAFDLWAEVTPLKFRYSDTDPDIEIKFVRGDHGDGWGNRFEGKGGVLAHAYGPGQGIGGDTHFDEDEDWTMNTDQGLNLLAVAAHEFGHALGLGHSSVRGALMMPFYRNSDELQLSEDDIQGIQAIYGRKKGHVTLKPDVTVQPPSPTTTTTTTTTGKKTTTTDDNNPWTPFFCGEDFRLDAISEGPDGYLYAYREDQIFKLGPRGLEFGFPRYIAHVFPGAPRKHLRAVTYLPEYNITYMFKDSRVWRFTGFRLNKGYPRIWSHDHFYRPSAALTLTHNENSQIFMFGHDYFWEWSPYTESVVPGYPLPLDIYFPHVPMLPDAAFLTQKKEFLFFKYNSYIKMAHRGISADPLPIGSGLFGSLCGGSRDIFRVFSLPTLSHEPFYDPGYVETSHSEFSPLIQTLISDKSFGQLERGPHLDLSNIQKHTSQERHNLS